MTVTTRDGFGGSVSDDFTVAVSRTAQTPPWDIRAESPSGTSAIVRVRWNAPTDLAGVEAYYVRVRRLGDQTRGRFHRVGLDASEDLRRYLEPDTTYEASVCAGEDVGEQRLLISSQIVNVPRYDNNAVCSGWTSIRLPPAPANDFTLSLELPGGGTKATVAWDGTLRYRIRVSGVYDSSVLEFHTSTVGIAATRLGSPGERIPEFTPYDSNSNSFFTYRGMARKFIVWDSPTSGYWERTQTVWTGAGAKSSHVLELIDEPARFMGSRMNRIGTPSSLCVEITDSMGTVTGPCASPQVEVDPPTGRGRARGERGELGRAVDRGRNGGGDARLQRGGGGRHCERRAFGRGRARRPGGDTQRRVSARQRHGGAGVRLYADHGRRRPHRDGGHAGQSGAERWRHPKRRDERGRCARAQRDNRSGGSGTQPRSPDRAL